MGSEQTGKMHGFGRAPSSPGVSRIENCINPPKVLFSVHFRQDSGKVRWLDLRLGRPSDKSRTVRVLVIEDDEEAAQFIAKGLRESGWTVDLAGDGARGLTLALSGPFDALIVDRMLPEMDGLTIVETVRRTGSVTPVLILSAMDSVDNRVEGLRAGGDDYLTKPFAFSELLARLEALTRRGQSPGADTTLCVADLEMDLLARRVRRGGETLDLKPREFKILEVLMRHPGQVVTRTMLLESVWDYQFDPQTNVIDVHMSRLRKKLGGSAEAPLLETVRGAGYRLGE